MGPVWLYGVPVSPSSSGGLPHADPALARLRVRLPPRRPPGMDFALGHIDHVGKDVSHRPRDAALSNVEEQAFLTSQIR